MNGAYHPDIVDFPEMMDFIRDNPRRLPELVEAKDVSRDAAITESGLPRGSWWAWENGTRPNSESARRLVRYFEKEIQEVIEREQGSRPEDATKAVQNVPGGGTLLPVAGTVPGPPPDLDGTFGETRWIMEEVIAGAARAYVVRLSNDDMSGFGMPAGTDAVIAEGLDIRGGDFALVEIDGVCVIRRLQRFGGVVVLESDAGPTEAPGGMRELGKVVYTGRRR